MTIFGSSRSLPKTEKIVSQIESGLNKVYCDNQAKHVLVNAQAIRHYKNKF